MKEYQKERINKGIEAAQPLISIIRSYNINNLSNNVVNLFEKIKKKAEENDKKFYDSGVEDIYNGKKEYSSLVANVTFDQLLDVGYDGVLILIDCVKAIEDDENTQKNKVDKREKNKLQHFFDKMKIKTSKSEKLTEETIQIVNNLLYRYYRYDNCIENYKLEDNIASALVDYIKKSINPKKKDVRKYLVNSNIKEDLTKLGYENLYHGILLELSKFYKMDLVRTPHFSNVEKEYNEVEAEDEYVEPTKEEEIKANEMRKKIIFTKNNTNIENAEKTPDNER